MVEIGAQGSDYAVEVTLLNGDATLEGSPLGVDRPVVLPGVGTGDVAKLVFSTETCTLKICPKAKADGADSGGAMRMGDGGGGGNNPPPPYPGGGNSHN